MRAPAMCMYQWAVRLARELSPDIVIMDVVMPLLNGVEAARQILQAVPGIRVVALSMHSDGRFIVEMLKLGTAGYILKDCAFEELMSAVRLVATGRTYLSPKITRCVVGGYISHVPVDKQSVFTLLTPREREVLQLLAEGESTRSIADKFQRSVKTIETYRQQIMSKVGIRSVAELTRYAIREGLTSLGLTTDRVNNK